jgi:hypothetical protein
LTPLTIKSVLARSRQDKLATSTLQPSTAASEDDLHLRQEQAVDAARSIIKKLEGQPFKV